MSNLEYNYLSLGTAGRQIANRYMAINAERGDSPLKTEAYIEIDNLYILIHEYKVFETKWFQTLYRLSLVLPNTDIPEQLARMLPHNYLQ